MKTITFLSAFTLLLFSCQSDSSEEADKGNSTQQENSEAKEQTEVSKDIVYASDDTGTKEYMKLVINEKGKREWYYWSDKKEDEVKLGVKEIDGLEAVHFFGKKNELYEIAGSECGFSLFLGEERLQWYEQIEPECTRTY